MPDAKELQRVVKDVAERLRQRRVSIAIVGDMILDNTVEGVPGGRHPDIAVPILREASTQESIGGAANMALILARLGVEVALFGVIGSDLPGRQLENLLDRQPFADYLITERGWPTPHKDWIYQRQEGRLHCCSESITTGRFRRRRGKNWSANFGPAARPRRRRDPGRPQLGQHRARVAGLDRLGQGEKGEAGSDLADHGAPGPAARRHRGQCSGNAKPLRCRGYGRPSGTGRTLCP